MKVLRTLRRFVADQARALPVARAASARLRRAGYERRIARFVRERSGRADRLPDGVVYEATMRCNLHCAASISEPCWWSSSCAWSCA